MRNKRELSDDFPSIFQSHFFSLSSVNGAWEEIFGVSNFEAQHSRVSSDLQRLLDVAETL